MAPKVKRPWFRRKYDWSKPEPILDVDWQRWLVGSRWGSNLVIFFGPLAYLHRRPRKETPAHPGEPKDGQT